MARDSNEKPLCDVAMSFCCLRAGAGWLAIWVKMAVAGAGAGPELGAEVISPNRHEPMSRRVSVRRGVLVLDRADSQPINSALATKLVLTTYQLDH